MEMIAAVSRYPEWRALYDAILPHLDAGETSFTYDVLSSLAKIDIREHRGRAQFYRFRRQMLKDRRIWFENVSTTGYVVIPAGDHQKAAMRRVGSARRRLSLAGAINRHVDYEKLTNEQRIIQAATAAVLHNLSKQFHAAGNSLAAASMAASKNLPVNLDEVLRSVKPVPKIKAS